MCVLSVRRFINKAKFIKKREKSKEVEGDKYN